MKSSTKACALDPMPTWLLKELLPSIALLMTDFINSSLQSGVIPDSMKSAAVTPLFKKPSLNINIIKNYRPVSNLPFVSKVLERVVASQLKTYMDYNDLHDPLQSAYKTAHSTQSALLKVQKDILRTVDHGGVVVLVLLDLSAAFDTIDHSIQHQLGINGVAHAWFESYLTRRTQRIQIGDAWSLAKFLLYCVPQGLVLGSLLFLIYILPLHHLILSHGLQVHGYADDTAVYLSISDPANPDTTRQECARLESCLTDIHLWMSANKLKLNSDKTEVLVVGTECKPSSFNLTAISVAGCRVLVSGKPISNLGVSFDRNLSMCNQVHRVVRSAYFHLRSIGLARKMLTVVATKQLVQALVISRLDYCNSLLTGIPNKPHEPARNGPISSCSSHLAILRAPVCNCVDEGPTLVASHFLSPLQGPCPSI